MMGRISRLNLTGSAPAVNARLTIRRTVRSECGMGICYNVARALELGRGLARRYCIEILSKDTRAVPLWHLFETSWLPIAS